ncbi:hypothetical protein APICC_08875 [Apis cerana cerana]|uniref:Uncharacterized protein n=1 Tax=Apis cerana cerana TaxID=94128 RepID=A0A2A3ESQ4_APICC|nr:hypothetical protein APICC_08875 [Apis cerana cerana]
MAQDIPRTTYLPEVEEDARKERERRTVQEGTATWKRRKEELQRQKHREQRELQQLLKNYSPWGKPGGGAPCAATLRKKNVPLEPLELSKCHDFGQGWTSDSTIERLHGRSVNPLPVTDMNKFFDDRPEGVATGMQLAKSYSKNPYNEEVQVYELTGGVELVPLLTTRRYCSRSKGARHIATDATRPGCTIDSLRTLEVGNREYIAELCDQMRRKEEKLCEKAMITLRFTITNFSGNEWRIIFILNSIHYTYSRKIFSNSLEVLAFSNGFTSPNSFWWRQFIQKNYRGFIKGLRGLALSKRNDIFMFYILFTCYINPILLDYMGKSVIFSES